MTRITPQHTVHTALQNTQKHSLNIARFQRELSTGLRLHQGSDDPTAMERLLALRARELRFDSDLTAISHINSVLNQSVSHLQEARSILNRAKQIAIDATQPDGESLRGVHAGELDVLLDRLTAIANASDSGRFLFGGSASDGPPFVRDHDTVVYQGSTFRSDVPLGTNQLFDVLYPGSELFMTRDRQQTVITGSTGAKPAGTTDSEIGSSVLSVRHTTTNYEPGSGVVPGTRSPNEDTILGAVGTHRLTLIDTSGNGSSGTVSLNGGPTVAFSNTDANLRVRNGTDTIFIDTRSITAGFSGDLLITADGTLSVDGGETEIAIDFTAAQIVSNSDTGRVTGIDSRDIVRTGADRIEYPGTLSAFATITALRDTLTNSELTQAQVHYEATSGIRDLERHADVILSAVGEKSLTLEALENLRNRSEDLRLQTRVTIAEIESADLAEAAVGLQNEQRLLEMTYGALARALDLSLFDYLR